MKIENVYPFFKDFLPYILFIRLCLRKILLCTPDRTLTCIDIFRRDVSNTIRPQEHNAGCFKIYIPNLFTQAFLLCLYRIHDINFQNFILIVISFSNGHVNSRKPANFIMYTL